MKNWKLLLPQNVHSRTCLYTRGRNMRCTNPIAIALKNSIEASDANKPQQQATPCRRPGTIDQSIPRQHNYEHQQPTVSPPLGLPSDRRRTSWKPMPSHRGSMPGSVSKKTVKEPKINRCCTHLQSIQSEGADKKTLEVSEHLKTVTWHNRSIHVSWA